MPPGGSPIAFAETTNSPLRPRGQFYDDDASFLIGFTCFLEAALEAGNAVIVIATSPTGRLSFRDCSPWCGCSAAIEERRYIPWMLRDALDIHG